jgi:hypothetical protein
MENLKVAFGKDTINVKPNGILDNSPALSKRGCKA